METTPTSTTKRTTLCNLSKSSSLTPCRRLGLSRPSPGSLKRSAELLVIPPEHKQGELTEDNSRQNVECGEKPKRHLKTSATLNQSLSLKSEHFGTSQKQLQSTVKRSIINSPIEYKNTNLNAFLHSPLSDKKARLKDDLSYHVKKRKLSLKSELSNEEAIECNKRISYSQPKSIAQLDVTAKEYVSNNKRTENILKEVTPEMIQGLLQIIKEKRKKLDLSKVQEIYGKKHKLEEVQAQTAQWRVGGQEALRYSLQLARQAGVPITLQQLMAQHGFPPHLMDYNEEYDEFN